MAPVVQAQTTEAEDPRMLALLGAAMEVHRQLGCRFQEGVYQDALALEFGVREVPFQRGVELGLSYKGLRLHTNYSADFVCFESIIVEVRAVEKLQGVEEAQVLNYLKSTGFERGLLLNFGAAALEYRQFTSANPQSTQISQKSA